MCELHISGSSDRIKPDARPTLSADHRGPIIQSVAPGRAANFRRLADTAGSEGRWEWALYLYNRTLEIDSKDTQALCMAARISDEVLGRLAQAEDYCRQAVEFDGDCCEGLRVYASLLLRKRPAEVAKADALLRCVCLMERQRERTRAHARACMHVRVVVRVRACLCDSACAYVRACAHFTSYLRRKPLQLSLNQSVMARAHHHNPTKIGSTKVALHGGLRTCGDSFYHRLTTCARIKPPARPPRCSASERACRGACFFFIDTPCRQHCCS